MIMEITACETEIQRFYKDSTVFLTGATGFIGKLLLEKILRSLPVKKVYVLIRTRNGVPSSKRVLGIFESPVFDRIKQSHTHLLEKVSIIDGDLTEPILGLNKEDQQKIINEVNIIFHCAATTRFNECLKKATLINVKGPIDIINLAKKAINLKVFMHMSTAFANCNLKEISEKIYPSKIMAEKLIQTCNSLNDECLEAVANILAADWPNIYTFTKQVVEDYIKREAKHLPMCICRPSIVISTAEEPIRSFIDNLFTLSGFGLIVGLGMTRIIHYKKEAAHVVPADYLVNECIASGWLTGENFLKKQTTEVPVYNITSAQDNPITFDYINMKSSHKLRNLATKKMVAYPMTFMTKCKYNYFFWRFLLHTMVGYLLDAVRMIQGKKPKFAAAMKKLNSFQDAYAFFTSTPLLMDTENTAELLERMSIKDKELFNFNIKALNWESYFTDYPKGLRFYLLNENMDTLPEAQKHYDHLRRVMIAVVLFGVIFVYVVGKLVLYRWAPFIFRLVVDLLRFLVC